MTIAFLAWIFLGEFLLLFLVAAISGAWVGRIHKKRTLAAVEALLDRFLAQEPERMAQRTRTLRSLFPKSAEAAVKSAQDMGEAEREFFRSMLTPLLKDDPDFVKNLDQALYLFSDAQLDIVSATMPRETRSVHGESPPADEKDQGARLATRAVAFEEEDTEDLLLKLLADEPESATPPAPEAGAQDREANGRQTDDTDTYKLLPPLPETAPEPFDMPMRSGRSAPSAAETKPPTEMDAAIEEKLTALETVVDQLTMPIEDATVGAYGGAASEAKGPGREQAPSDENLPTGEQAQPRKRSKPRGKKKKDTSPTENSGE